MRKFALLTSGGDAPGMNAAIRSVTRSLLFYENEVIGIRRGYEGLLDEDFLPMSRSSVGGILLHGGTILKTARSPQFMCEEGINKAVENLKKYDIDGLVVIGGDGTFRGAEELHNRGVSVIGIPATIDNDIFGTDATIGFDTACNTALECISKLRDTASSHERMFIVEVMGRDSGFLALETGVACGAEYVVLPEKDFNINDLCDKVNISKLKGKTHSIVVLAEGAMSANELRDILKKNNCVYTPKVVVLGYLQRGGVPTCFDTVLASKLGVNAVTLLLADKSGLMVGIDGGKVVSMPMELARSNTKKLNKDMLTLIDILSI